MPNIFLVVGERDGFDSIDIQQGVRFSHGVPAVANAVAELEELLSNSIYETAYNQDDIEDFVRGTNYLLAQVDEDQ